MTVAALYIDEAGKAMAANNICAQRPRAKRRAAEVGRMTDDRAVETAGMWYLRAKA